MNHKKTSKFQVHFPGLELFIFIAEKAFDKAFQLEDNNEANAGAAPSELHKFCNQFYVVMGNEILSWFGHL